MAAHSRCRLRCIGEAVFDRESRPDWITAMLLLWLIIGLLPFALPIISLIRQSALRSRLTTLEAAFEAQQRTVDDLTRRLTQLKRDAAAVPPLPVPPAAVRPPSVTPPVVATPPPSVTPPITAAPPRPTAPESIPAVSPPAAQRIERPPVHIPEAPPPPPPVPLEPSPRPAPASVFAAFDWEQFVGVKLFSAVAGIALVMAAIFFLRYSLDRGWLAPPVRIVIGIIVATALLVVCELRAAHRYRVTANALDAAAIAILFSTFFAAHALWNLIPSAATFGLLALVTVLAVLLSIRHDSIFIALLGLVGGFATPALLSTGENRPIPLFTYLLLLNVGLAWVAVRKKWPVLTILTLAFTTVYQWGWVVSFLSASDLTLGMGIFLVFSVTSFIALTLGRRAGDGGATELTLERSGLAASAMPLVFAIFLAAVPQYGVHTGLLFGFLLIVVVGLSVVAVAQRDDRLHAIGGTATVLVFAMWLANSHAAGGWRVAVTFTVIFASFYALVPLVAERLRRPFAGLGARVVYASPIVLFVFPVIVRIEAATAAPLFTFSALFVVLALIAWRALATGEAGLYLVAAFFALAAEASWSATHLVAGRLGAAIALYTAFALFYLGVPLAWRRAGRAMKPRWGSGALLLASLALLLFLADGQHAAASLWGLALLLAILDAGLFIESASGDLPLLSAIGAALSWFVLAIWWGNAAAAVGLLPSLLVLVGLTLVMLGGYAWAHATSTRVGAGTVTGPYSFRHGVYLALVGQLFLFFIAQDPKWATPPWPMFAALAVMTLAATAASLSVSVPALHAGGVVAAALVVLSFSQSSPGAWGPTSLAAAEVVVAYGVGSLITLVRVRQTPPFAGSVGAVAALFVAELIIINASHAGGVPLLAASIVAHVINLSLILALVWQRRWPYVAPMAVLPAWLATAAWQSDHPAPADWKGAMTLAAALYAVFVAYPFVLHRRARDHRDPYFTAVFGSVFFFFAARSALLAGGLQAYVGIVPVADGVVMALVLRELLRIQPAAQRDLGRLALVAGAALSFATVAIPLQLNNQWITIGWALEGAALSWLYRRVPHKGLLFAAAALLAVVFVRLALNPSVLVYEPRGSLRIINWYLYTYLTCGAAMLAAASWLSKTDDRIAPQIPRTSSLLPVAAVIVLFLLLNIEVADFYATGPEITFRFGVTLAQDLTYTIAWLVFGLGLLTAGIYLHSRYGRIAAVALIAVTTSKAFLYDLGSLGGLYRVGSLVGLAVSLSLVALALQKFVLLAPKEQS
jgi:uncharacterized membrane protein